MRIAKSRSLQDQINTIFSGRTGPHFREGGPGMYLGGHCVSNAERLETLCNASPGSPEGDAELFRLSAVLHNPSSILLLKDATVLEQSLAVSESPSLLSKLPKVAPLVQASILATRDGARLYSQYPEAFDMAAIEGEFPGFSAYVEGAQRRCQKPLEGSQLAGVFERFFQFDAPNDEEAMVEQVTRDPSTYY